MAALLKDKDNARRECMIAAIADDVAGRLDPSMLADGRLTFPQQAFVAVLPFADTFSIPPTRIDQRLLLSSHRKQPALGGSAYDRASSRT